MLTIFSIPKAFAGHIGIIQKNAITSWVRLYPACDIILCGDDTGTGEIANALKVKHIPNVARNEYGTPLLNSAFDQVARIAAHPVLCYVNADIILMSNLIETVQRIKLKRFLLAGQRWDVEISEPWDFEQQNWERRLSEYISEKGVLHPPSGSDYFVFPRDNAMGKLAPFAVGRPAWDNWFIYNTRKLGIPVIDCTGVVTVIHQNHDYSHVPNRKGKAWEGPEADTNRALINGWEKTYTLLDATHIMTTKRIVPATKI